MRISIYLLFFLLCTNVAAQRQGFHAFDELWQDLILNYSVGNTWDYKSMKLNELNTADTVLLHADTGDFHPDRRMAMMINAYNFYVVKRIASEYPVASVKEISGFFSQEIPTPWGYMSLDALEQEILDQSDDPFVHLLLNCGAHGCPPVRFIDHRVPLSEYINRNLELPYILDKEKDTGHIMLSRIFFWYRQDFEADSGWKERLFISLKSRYPDHKDMGHLVYKAFDWRLNDVRGQDFLIYIPTKLYRKGGWELKVFNNYYTQTEQDTRSNFFSTFFQLLIGTNKRLNWGLDIKLRSVTSGDVALFSALALQNRPYYLSSNQPSYARFDIAAIGPRIRYQPVARKGNINILHAIYFVPAGQTEGGFEYGYFDFQHVQIFNNLWYEKEFTARRRLFVDIGFHLENLDTDVSDGENHLMQWSLPVTAIYSYYPGRTFSMYILGNIAPQWQWYYHSFGRKKQWAAYAQAGVGVKYYLTSFLEAELLYTRFMDTQPDRTAHTFNLGLRFFKFTY